MCIRDRGIILTQEPEHYMSDLVPGRRPFMVLVLEAISLAGRPYALDELPGLKPFLSFNKENYIPRGRLWGIWFDDCLLYTSRRNFWKRFGWILKLWILIPMNYPEACASGW